MLFFLFCFFVFVFFSIRSIAYSAMYNYTITFFMKEEMFYLMTHLTHFIYDYMGSHIRITTTEIRRGHPLPSLHGLLFLISSKGSFNAPSHKHDSTYHGLSYTSRGALTWMRNRSMGPPGGIDPTTYHTISGRSTIEFLGFYEIRCRNEKIPNISTDRD